MTVIAWICAALAALVHCVIFYLESAAWGSPRATAVFGEVDAEATRFMAFNQGFYNLFLAVVTVTGIAFWASGAAAVGAALLVAGLGSMLAAALVLAAASPAHRGAALKQGAFPLLGLLAAAAALV